jgi:hypothetical protein
MQAQYISMLLEHAALAGVTVDFIVHYGPETLKFSTRGPAIMLWDGASESLILVRDSEQFAYPEND